MFHAVAAHLVTCAAAGAVAMLPLQPPGHVHRAGIEGRSQAVAHSHQVVGGLPVPEAHDGVGIGLTPPHGNHANATFLSAAFDRGGSVRLAPVPAVEPFAGAAASDSAVVSIATAGTESDPPRPSSPPRGPPSRPL